MAWGGEMSSGIRPTTDLKHAQPVAKILLDHSFTIETPSVARAGILQLAVAALASGLCPPGQLRRKIYIASDDGLGFVPHSLELYQEWFAAGQPAELHVYEKGDHGFGFSPKGTTSDMWTQNFENWLIKRNLIP